MTAAPGLLPDAARAKKLGAKHVWINGDANHTYGGHLDNPPRFNPGATDYTEVGPLNNPPSLPRVACAMDVTDEWPASHLWVAHTFDECRRGDQPEDLFELIGAPAGSTRPLYWNATKRVVELYRGPGHVKWFHAMKGRRFARTDGLWFAGWGPHGLLKPDAKTLVGKMQARLAEAHVKNPSAPLGFPLRRHDNPAHGMTHDATKVPARDLLSHYGSRNPISRRQSVRHGTKNNELVRYIEALTNTGTEAHDSYFGAGLHSLVKGLQARARIPVHGEVDELTLIKVFGQPERWA